MSEDSKLGGLPGLSQDTPVLQPAPVVSFDNVTDAFNRLAQSAQDIANTEFGKESAKEGQQAVTRDASGNIEYSPPGLLSKITGTQAAYVQAAKARYVSESALDVAPKVAGMREQYTGNPDGFRQALDTYSGAVLNNTPEEFQPAVRGMIDQEGASALANITAEKQKSDFEDSKNSQLALRTQYVNQLYAMARSDQVGTPDYNAMVAKVQAIETSLKANPGIHLDPSELAGFDALQPNLRGEAVVAHAAGLYDSTKDEAKAEQYLTQHLNDPSLGVSDTEAHELLSRGLAEIRTQHALAQQDAAQAQYQVEYKADDAYKLALTQGPEARQAFMPDNEIYAAYPNNRPHAQQIIERMQQAETIFASTNALKTATPAQAKAYLDKLDPRNAAAASPTAGGFDQAWQFTLQHEGGYAAHDANGQPVNFGINQGANPDVDVSKLTPDQAKQIAQERYWNPSGAGSLPPAMQAAAFDTAYIFGPTAAKQMVAQADGDPQKLIDIRAQHMQDLIDKDPAKFGKYTTAWEQRNNDLRAVVSGTGLSGLDYAAKVNAYTASVAAYQNIQKQLHADPATYIRQNVPGVDSQLASNDPATVQAGVRALLTNEKGMGVAAPSVLTAPEKTNILAAFNNPPEGKTKAQNTIDVLNSLEQRYGQYYPQVMGELGSKAPPEIGALDWVRHMSGNDAPVVAARMGSAVDAGRQMLNKLLPNEGKELDTQVVAALAPYTGTMKGLGGTAVAAQMVQTAGLYARQLKAEGVADDTAAASQAVQDLYGSQYHAEGSYRVPAGIEPGTIARGTDALLSRLDPHVVEPIGREAPGVPFSQRQQMALSALKAHGEWVTLPDDSGLALTWGPAEAWRTAREANGITPIQYTWAQLQAAASVAAKPVPYPKWFTPGSHEP